MKSLPFFASALLAFTALAHAALDVRTATIARQAVSIDGNAIPEVKSWSGGEAVSEVTLIRSGGSNKVAKSLGRLTYAPIVIEASPPFSPALQATIAQFLGGNETATLTPTKKTLLLAQLDASNQPVGETLQATGAFLSEIQFPAFDASARTPLVVKFIFRADSTIPVTAAIPAASGGNTRNTNALASNFTLAIDGIGTSRISKIDAFTLRREVGTHSSGGSLTSLSIGELTVPNLVLSVGSGDSDSWKTWRASFIPQSGAPTTLSAPQKKNGSLQLLSADMATPLFSLQLSGIAPIRLSTPPLEPGANTLLQLRAEVFCEAMSVAAPAPVTAQPATVTPAKLITREPLATRELPARTAPAATPAPAAGAASPDDKGVRDPADFPRPPDVVRTSFSSKRDTSSVREIAYYTAKTKADSLIVFYEKSLTSAGWKETSRQEDNSGPGKTYAITSTWTKESRTAQLVLGDVSPEKTEIYVSLLEKK